MNNFDEALERILKNLDRRYATIRGMAADPKHFNSESREIEAEKKEFRELLDDAFRLKCIRDTCHRLSPNP